MKREVWETVLADVESSIEEEKTFGYDMLELCKIEGMLIAISTLLFYEKDLDNATKCELMSRIQGNLNTL